VLVAVPPGSGVLARTVDVGGGNAGLLSLIDDRGRRYPIADADALKALGLTAAPQLAVPDGLLRVIDTGPQLAVDAARRPVTAQGTGSSPAAGPPVATPSDGAASAAGRA
jgi:hypothetical protein